MKKMYILIFGVFFLNVSYSQIGAVQNYSKISSTQGNFSGTLNIDDHFGIAEVIGDLNNDGFEDIAVGSRYDDDGGTDRGAVWILFLNENRTVLSHQKISSLEGNFTGDLDDDDQFGSSVVAVGDIDGDNIVDLSVGAWADDDDISNSGAVWILFMNTDGTVKSHQKISATQGGIIGLTENRHFGINACALGDLNNDNVPDIAVGSPAYDNDGGLYRGCVWILFLNTDGTVNSQQKINDYHGTLNFTLEDNDRFGYGLANLGDLNNDGITDIAASALYDDDGFTDAGAVYILFLDTDGTVKTHQKISATEGGFTGSLNYDYQLGYSTHGINDIDGDGVRDIAIGGFNDDDGGTDRGAVWIIMLNNDGTVKSHQKISATEGNFTGELDDEDHFGMFITQFKTGNKELVASAHYDDDGATNAGAVWILNLNNNFVSVKQYLSKLENLIIFPNPSSDYISISNFNNYEINSMLRIYDNSGRLVKEDILTEKINISDFKKGIYIIQVFSKSKIFTGKFIKE